MKISRETVSIILLFTFIILLILNVAISSYKVKKDFEYQQEAKQERLEGKKERLRIIEQNQEQIELLKNKKK